MADVKRSTGIIVPGWYGPRPGGGYEGLTRELDDSVVADADWLKEHYPGLPVEIRFNANRESGGAFIELTDKIMGPSAGIGSGIVNAGMAEDSGTSQSIIGLKFQAGDIRHNVYVSQRFLKERSAANDVFESNIYHPEPKAYHNFRTNAEARRWFEDNVDPTRLTRRVANHAYGPAKADLMRE